MKLITLFFILFLLFFAQTKAVKKILQLSNFEKQGPFIFLTKFLMAEGYGQIDITYTKGQEMPSQSFYNDLSIGIVNSTFYSQFLAASTCEEKSKFFQKRQRLYFKQERHGIKHMKVFDINEQQLWYFYLYSCLENLEQLKNTDEEINLVFGVLTNGSHFASYDHSLYAYIIIVVVWGLLIVKFAIPIGALLTFKNPDSLKLSIFGGLLILGAGYLYRLIHLILYNMDGLGIYIFDIFYVLLKFTGEAVITTVIISISWGWSLIHLKSSQKFIMIGVVAGVINIVSLVLSIIDQENEVTHHHYQTTPGIVILALRMILFFIFVAGISQCLKQSSGKIIFFIKKFAIIGGFYLLCWPATVFIVQLTLPNHLHREVIIFVEEIVHICACTVICNMISSPESAYRRVSLHQDDNPLRIDNYHKQ